MGTTDAAALPPSASGRVPLSWQTLRKSSGRALARAGLFAALALGASGAADAARYGVRVVDAAGEPVAGASVCIGIEGSYRRFGAMFTDARGRVELIDVPAVPLVVTVSRTRFSGLRFSQPARRYDLVREVVLESGVPGPRCKAGSSMVANPPGLDVLRVGITRDRGSVSLQPEVSGEPTHYRLGLPEALEAAPWQRFERSVPLPGELAAADVVHLQMRKREGGSNAWLESLSDVAEVVLRPAVAQP